MTRQVILLPRAERDVDGILGSASKLCGFLSVE